MGTAGITRSDTTKLNRSDASVGRSYALTQAAKTTLFAGGNEGDIRKKRRQATFFQ
jgi:hypothetical protein